MAARTARLALYSSRVRGFSAAGLGGGAVPPDGAGPWGAATEGGERSEGAIGAEGAEGEGAPASPIMTVKQPRTMTPPWTVGSPMRAAMRLPMSTVGEPMTIMSGGPTQVAISVTRAAGSIPISTVGQHGGRIGPPTCGTTPVTMGQTCMSVIRAAGGIFLPLLLRRLPRYSVQKLQSVSWKLVNLGSSPTSWYLSSRHRPHPVSWGLADWNHSPSRLRRRC